MRESTFKKKLIRFINQRLLIDPKNNQIDEKTELFKDRLINSIKIIELLAFIEKKLNITIDESLMSIENFSSVNQIADKFCKDEKSE